MSVDISDVFAGLQALSGDDPVAQADHAARIANLEEILKALPPHVATALVMHKLGGYTVQEIGDHLGVARETAKEYPRTRGRALSQPPRADGVGTLYETQRTLEPSREMIAEGARPGSSKRVPHR